MTDSVYDIGTVTVSAGGTTVTGVGTSWAGKVFAGDLFHDPAQGIIARVTADATSNTSLSINAWPGTPLAGAAYEILFQPDSVRTSERARRLLELVTQINNTGIGIDAFGLFAGRTTYDAEVTGFAYLSMDGDGALVTDPVVFLKASSASADWSGAISIAGTKGDTGDNVVWLAAAGAPAGATGADGDMYLDTTTGNVYGPKAAGAWGAVAANIKGIKGDTGDTGPANSLAIGTVTGGAAADATITGTAPTQTLNLVLPKGDAGTNGADGNDGWTPVLAIVADGARYVQQVVDWTGGEGTKPATGKYVGPLGFVDLIGDGVDIRGPSGAGTGDVVGPAGAVDGNFAAFDTATGKLIKDSGKSAADFATAAQGALADSAVQPGDLGTAAAGDTGTAAGNIPVLDGSGKLDTAVLPALAITDTFVVASQAAMLALVAEKGDIAIRSDLNKCFILSTNSPSTLADWKELLTPTDLVQSVAGLTGTISAAALKTALAIAQADVSGLGIADSPSFAGLSVGGVPVLPNMPRSLKSADYTLVLADAQTHILHDGNDNNPRTFTIPADASVAFPVGTVITFVNEVSTLTIAITSDTLVMTPSGATGPRTLAANGIATAIKVRTTKWMISGAGLS